MRDPPAAKEEVVPQDRSSAEDDEHRLRHTRKEIEGTIAEDVHIEYWKIVDEERVERPWTAQSHVLELLLRLGIAAYRSGWKVQDLRNRKPPPTAGDIR